MASGYLPVDTPPGTTPMPLGSPVPATVATSKAPPQKSGKGKFGKSASPRPMKRKLKLRRRSA